jgi:hypothetical protein
MKKHAKQTLADLKSQATSSSDFMVKLAQWDECGEMPVETQQKIFGGALPGPAIGDPIFNPDPQGIWFPFPDSSYTDK